MNDIGFKWHFERGDTKKYFSFFLFFEVRLKYLDGGFWVERFQENTPAVSSHFKMKYLVGVLWSSYFVFRILIEYLTEEVSL